VRILGVSMEAGAPGGVSKNSGLFSALARRYHLVDVVAPTFATAEDLLHKALRVHPDRSTWRKRYNLHPLTFRRRSHILERELTRREGSFDWIVQLHTQFAPGTRPRPYVLHTDNTYVLSERHYPPWAPLRGRTREGRVRLEREVFQRAAFLFPRSDFLRRSLVEDYGCDPARVIRVGGGANLCAASLEGKRYDQQVALFVGLEFERKGGLQLLRAWERVRGELPSARLQVVGDSNRWGPPPPGVEWIGPVNDRARLTELYRDASVFVMPSLFEPWGHVFYEAMGLGLGCIGTRTCAMPEIIEAGADGHLVDAGDVDSLAAALVRVLRDPDHAQALGQTAWHRVTERHTWDHVVGRMAPWLEGAGRPG
jgi:glycosyltransferase involved in cell wall biosynthesis